MAATQKSSRTRTLTWLLLGVVVGIAVAAVRYLLGEQQSTLSIAFTVLIPTVAAGIAASIKNNRK